MGIKESLLILEFVTSSIFINQVQGQLSVYMKNGQEPIITIPDAELDEDYISIRWANSALIHLIDHSSGCSPDIPVPSAEFRARWILLTTAPTCSIEDVVWRAEELGYEAVIIGPRKNIEETFEPRNNNVRINVYKVTRQIWQTLKRYAFFSFMKEDERYVFQFGPVPKKKTWEQKRSAGRGEERRKDNWDRDRSNYQHHYEQHKYYGTETKKSSAYFANVDVCAPLLMVSIFLLFYYFGCVRQDETKRYTYTAGHDRANYRNTYQPNSENNSGEGVPQPGNDNDGRDESANNANNAQSNFWQDFARRYAEQEARRRNQQQPNTERERQRDENSNNNNNDNPQRPRWMPGMDAMEEALRLLQLNRPFTTAQLERAYRRISLELHKDKTQTRSELSAEEKEIREEKLKFLNGMKEQLAIYAQDWVPFV